MTKWKVLITYFMSYFNESPLFNSVISFLFSRYSDGCFLSLYTRTSDGTFLKIFGFYFATIKGKQTC